MWEDFTVICLGCAYGILIIQPLDYLLLTSSVQNFKYSFSDFVVFFLITPPSSNQVSLKCLLFIFTGSGKQLSEDDIDFNLVEKFLKGVGSQLSHEIDKPPIYFYNRLKLVRHIGDKRDGEMLVPVWAPRNVALLFFHPAPHEFFTGAKTEIATYTHDGDVTEEEVITGPMTSRFRKLWHSF